MTTDAQDFTVRPTPSEEFSSEPIRFYSSDKDNNAICRVHTSGDHNEFLHLGDQVFHKNDLFVAFAGTMNPQLHRAPSRRLANPTPLGLAAFGLTTFVLSLCNCNARSISNPSIVMSLCFFYGGFVQLCAGQWEMVVENTFGFTAFSSYGAFWISYGAILCPAFGIAEAYTDPKEFASAVGFFLIGWMIFTTMMTMCLVKSTYPLFSLFLVVDIVFILLIAAEFTGSDSCKKAAGVLGIIASFLAWYDAFAGLANRNTFGFDLPPMLLPTAERRPKAKSK